MNGQYFIQTTDEKQAKLWDDWFNTDRLPVLAPNPREQARRGGAIDVYDVALMKLSQAQRDHFFAHVARDTRSDYETVKRDLENSLHRSYPISADSCIVLVESVQEDETAVSQQRRPFFIGWLARLFPRVAYG